MRSIIRKLPFSNITIALDLFLIILYWKPYPPPTSSSSVVNVHLSLICRMTSMYLPYFYCLFVLLWVIGSKFFISLKSLSLICRVASMHLHFYCLFVLLWVVIGSKIFVSLKSLKMLFLFPILILSTCYLFVTLEIGWHL